MAALLWERAICGLLQSKTRLASASLALPQTMYRKLGSLWHMRVRFCEHRHAHASVSSQGSHSISMMTSILPVQLQVVTHSQRFAALAEKVLRLDHGQIAYFGPPSSDPFRLWGREPGTSQVCPSLPAPCQRAVLLLMHVESASEPDKHVHSMRGRSVQPLPSSAWQDQDVSHGFLECAGRGDIRLKSSASATDIMCRMM